MLVPLFAVALLPQTQHAIFVVDKVTEQARGRAVGDSASAETAEHHSAPVVMGAFMQKCSVVSFTQDRSAAEFVLQTQPGSSILSNGKGDVLYVSPAKTLKNMVKDVCAYISAR